MYWEKEVMDRLDAIEDEVDRLYSETIDRLNRLERQLRELKTLIENLALYLMQE